MSWRRRPPREITVRTSAVAGPARAVLVLSLIALSACASFNPQPHDPIGYRARAVSQSDGAQ